MKKIYPLTIIAVFGLLTFGSCSKSSSSSTCTCKTKGVTGNDTTVVQTKVDSGFTSLSAECSAADASLKSVYGNNYGCHM